MEIVISDLAGIGIIIAVSSLVLFVVLARIEDRLKGIARELELLRKGQNKQ